KIADTPMLDDLALAHAHDVNAFELNFAVCCGDTKKQPFMCAVVGLVRRHAIAISELPMDFCMKVRERLTNIAVELAHTGFVGRHVWLGCVVDEVVVEKFFKNVESSFSLNLFGIPPQHSFRGVASV